MIRAYSSYPEFRPAGIFLDCKSVFIHSTDSKLDSQIDRRSDPESAEKSANQKEFRVFTLIHSLNRGECMQELILIRSSADSRLSRNSCQEKLRLSRNSFVSRYFHPWNSYCHHYCIASLDENITRATDSVLGSCVILRNSAVAGNRPESPAGIYINTGGLEGVRYGYII